MTSTPDVKTKTRCSGHCCRSFTISMSPEELMAEYKRAKDDPTRAKDIDQLYEMLIYLGQFNTNPIMRLRGESWTRKGLELALKDEEKMPHLQMEMRPTDYIPCYRQGMPHWYGCRHIQLNGDCGIYDKRPEMCRMYPNGRECAFADCTWDPKDQEKHRKKVFGERKLVEAKDLVLAKRKP